MSFSGFYQCLCAKGHAFDVDCFEAHSSIACPHCKKSVAWWNLVDTTNGFELEDCVELKESHAAINFTCGHCNQTKLVEPVRFFIPLDKGHKGNLARMYEEFESYKNNLLDAAVNNYVNDYDSEEPDFGGGLDVPFYENNE